MKSSDATRPNIVFVFADQMRASALGGLGVEGVRTPRLDALAAGGALFTRAVANHPVCGPARATLMTGRHSWRHGLVVNDQQLRTDLPCVAERLGAAGYRCGYVGKWHLDVMDRGAFIPPGPRRRRFDDLWAVSNCNHRYLNAFYYLDDDPEPVWIDGYEPEAQTDIAVDFIARSAGRPEPFCLFVSYGAPHCPYREIPPRWLERYPPESIRLKPNATPAADRAAIAGYYAHIEALDACCGRILDALDARGLRDNTLVVFTADHGDMLFSQDRGWKMKPWAESVGVPLIARWPGQIPAGWRCGAPVGLVDLAPTLLGLAGAALLPGADGADLSALFRGDASRAPEAQLIACPVTYRHWSCPEWRGVVTARHTYACRRDGEWLLYDDEADPHQLRNLAADTGAARERTALRDRLETMLAGLSDDFPSSDEAIERLVAGRIVNSIDRDELAPALVAAFEHARRLAPRPRDTGGPPEDIVRRPDASRAVRFFENETVLRGRRGEGRRRFHHDLFPAG